MDLVKTLRRRIGAGHTALGTFVVELRTPTVARFLQQGGFDFMLIDTEHGQFDASEVSAHIRAGKRWGVCPLVRVSGPERGEIMRALDDGAEGIMVPMCDSADDAERAVEFSKYPPLGQRGAHFARPHTEFAPPDDLGAYMEEANGELLTIVQIETSAAVERVDEIAAVAGVDMLYMGPGDLSVALGVPGQVTHPQVLAAAAEIGKACQKHGKIAGSHFTHPEALPELHKRGVRFVGFGAVVRMVQQSVIDAGAAARQVLESS